MFSDLVQECAMDNNSNNKIVTMSYVATGVLVGIVFFVLLEAAAAIATGSVGRFLSQDLVRHAVPVGAGIITWIILQSNKRVGVWADEVVTELRKIVWPSSRDTVAMTIMVCVMLLISGIVLGVFDIIGATVIDWFLHLKFF
jgi:preprotein translocase subunit SecE